METAQHDQTAETLGQPDPQAFQPAVAVLGMFVVLLGVSGLVDDSGLFTHSWWVVLVAAAVSACAVIIVRTAVSLRR